jgi:aconitate hydratase
MSCYDISIVRESLQWFGRPGATMADSDSHTAAVGSLGTLAIGVGGLEVDLSSLEP